MSLRTKLNLERNCPANASSKKKTTKANAKAYHTLLLNAQL